MSSTPEELSPEERLLKVIQAGAAAAAPATDASVGASHASPRLATQATDASATATPVGAGAAERATANTKPTMAAAPAKPADASVGADAVGRATAKLAPQAPAAAAPAKPAAASVGADASGRATVKTKTTMAAAPAKPKPAEPKLKLAPAPAPEAPTHAPEKPVPVSTSTPDQERGKIIGLRNVNRFLLVAVLAGILAVAYDLWADRPAPPLAGDGEAPLVDKFPQPESLPPLETLMQKAGQRNLFNLAAGPPPTNKDAGLGAKPAAAPAAFKLMGVSIDEKHPEESMAILRDQTSGNTYYLKPGQPVGDTDFVLGQIRPESVILKTQKGEMELR